MANLELRPMRLNSWRKIALGTWNAPGDPSVYGTLEIDARKMIERQRRWIERTGGKAPTVTAIVARAAALTLKAHPQINGLIRWGRIYHRTSVSVFLQTAVDDEGKELSRYSPRQRFQAPCSLSQGLAEALRDRVRTRF